MRKVEVWRCGLWKKQTAGDAEGWEPWSQRKVRESGAHMDTHKEVTSPKPLARKMRGAGFCDFLQPKGFKDWSFKGLWAWLG